MSMGASAMLSEGPDRKGLADKNGWLDGIRSAIITLLHAPSSPRCLLFPFFGTEIWHRNDKRRSA